MKKEFNKTDEAEDTMQRLLIAMGRWGMQFSTLGRGRAFQKKVLPERLDKYVGITRGTMQHEEKTKHNQQGEQKGATSEEMPEWTGVLGTIPTCENEEYLQISKRYESGRDTFTNVWRMHTRTT